MTLAFLLAPAIALAAAPSTLPPDHAERMTRGLALFRSDVGPLLKTHCLECHGGKKVKGDFDLATREDLLRGGEHGPSVTPFRPGESRLLKLLRREEEPYMPDEGGALPAEAIAKITEWIELGAPYDAPLVEGRRPSRDKSVVTAEDRAWWAFQPLAPATGKDIDTHLLEKAKPTGLGLAPVAGPRALIRRAYLDLTGLPPPPEEVESFARDPSPRAWEALIDRLLASPAYGERWARHWLDVARFAESSGFEHDYDRAGAFHFRDFVIKALNSDLPFDQFLQWQLAGDEFAPGNALALSATGFLGAGVFPTQITANEVERTRYDAMDDMLSTTSSAFLGLTVGCARCHDHKYDPIPAKDYYHLLSTFTTTVRSVVDLDLDPDKTSRASRDWQTRADELRAALDAREKTLEPAFAAWLASRPVPDATGPAWRTLRPQSLVSKAGATFRDLGDDSFLAEGKSGSDDEYTFISQVKGEPVTALRLEALAHPSMRAGGGPGRADNGNIALSRIRVFAAGADGRTNEVKIARAEADFEQNKGSLSIAASLDNDPKSGWAVDPQFGKDHRAMFVLDAPLDASAGLTLKVVLEFYVNTRHTIGRPRLAVTSLPAPMLDGEVRPAAVDAALAEVAAGRPLEAPARDALKAWWRARDPELAKASAAVAAHDKAKPKGGTQVLVCAEGHTPLRMHTQGADFFNETYRLKRGNTELKDGVVGQNFLQALMPDAEAGARWKWTPPAGAPYSGRRRSLAQWLTDTEHGAGALVARVAVNRLWQHHFGRGIVATPNDFGRTGDAPTHPELLDELARALVAQGWKLKPLHRQMMLSRAYQQGTARDPAREATDPDNRTFLRRLPTRLEGEAIRDGMLAVSGLLDPALYGPGTKDERSRRRSIYFTIKRSQLIGSMVAFDAPEPLTSQGARPVTTVAPQALYVMNGPAVRSWAEAFAERVAREAPAGAADRVARAYALALGRAPTAEETADATAFLASQEQGHAADGRKQPAQVAMADFCQVVLGLNEFAYLP